MVPGARGAARDPRARLAPRVARRLLVQAGGHDVPRCAPAAQGRLSARIGPESSCTSCSREAKHDTGAVSKLHTFYSPREAAMVTEFFREDLRMFDYPEWGAAPGTVPWLA